MPHGLIAALIALIVSATGALVNDARALTNSVADLLSPAATSIPDLRPHHASQTAVALVSATSPAPAGTASAPKTATSPETGANSPANQQNLNTQHIADLSSGQYLSTQNSSPSAKHLADLSSGQYSASARASTPNVNAASANSLTTGLVLGAATSALDAVTHAEFNAALNALRSQFSAPFSFSGPAATTPVSVATFASAQKIDNLSNVTISNATVNGLTGLTDADIPNDITASNYLPLAGGTLTGSVIGTDLTLSGNLTVSGAQTLSGAITIPYLEATSTTSTSTISGPMTVQGLTIGKGGGSVDTNTAFGTSALEANTSGNRNTAVGNLALQNNTTGFYNAAFGNGALQANTSGDRNTAIGGLALLTVETGSSNTAIGHQAGDSTGTDISDNTFLGSLSGRRVAGDGNIMIGYQAGDNTSTGDTNILLGYKIDLPDSAGSNQLSIGNIIYGTGLDGTSTTVPSGNVGIGTTSPYAKLSVAGQGVFNNVWTTSTTATNYFGGNVGIGTTSPTALLHISSTAAQNLFQVDDNGPGDTSPFFIDQTGLVSAPVDVYADAGGTASRGLHVGPSGNAGAFLYLSTGDAEISSRSGKDLLFTSGQGNTALVKIDNGGNVGIGTTSPGTFKLQVKGNVGPDAANTYNLGSASLAWECLYYDGGTQGTCASDERLKTNIQDLTFQDPLDQLVGLKLRTFSYKSATSTRYHGLIAQEVEQVAPELVVTDASTTLKAVRYGDIQWLLVAAVQQLIDRLDTLATTVANLAESFTTKLLTAGEIHTDKLCVQGTCVTGAQLAALLSQTGAASTPISASPSANAATSISVSPSGSGDPASSTPDLTNSKNPDNANPPSDAAASSTADQAQPPVIEINGENPAHIHVGDTYQDLGARITGPTDADKNLGIKTFLNGKLVSIIVINTTQVATDTIDYVATDPAGLSATSTRTVLIEAAASASPVSPNASSTQPAPTATSTEFATTTTAG